MQPWDNAAAGFRPDESNDPFESSQHRLPSGASLGGYPPLGHHSKDPQPQVPDFRIRYYDRPDEHLVADPQKPYLQGPAYHVPSLNIPQVHQIPKLLTPEASSSKRTFSSHWILGALCRSS